MASTTDTKQDMLAKETIPLNLPDIQKRMKDGDEPTPVLLGLVSSPLIDLKLRELAKVYSAVQEGRPVVLAIIYDAEWVEGKGILEKQSVGKTETPA